MYKEVQEITLPAVNLHGFFDFGKDAFSTLEVELDTDFPQNLEIIVGEKAENGKIIHTAGFRTFIQHIMLTGTGHQVIKFPIHSFIPAWLGNPYCSAPAGCDGEIAPFRYVEVNRFYGKITARRSAYFCDWDDAASDFKCSDPDLQKVWDFCKYSIKAASVFDKYVDGERERMPYEGDAFINQLGHFCNMADYGKAKATIDHFFEYGEFTWPTEWLLLTPFLVRDYLLYSGDRVSVNRWLPLLEDKILSDCRDEKGLLNDRLYKERRPKVRDLVDWPVTERDNYDFQAVNFVPNVYLYEALKVMEFLTGEEKYCQEAAAVRNALRQNFLRDGVFVDSPNSEHTSLHTAFFALHAGLAEGEEISRLKEIIVSRDMACSVYCAQFLLEACFANGMADHALHLMRSDSDRSWLNMLREGATISMESWGDKWKSNQDWNHAWGAAPANVITRWLCGIRPLKPGFAEFTVSPEPGDLEFFSCRQPTVYGAVTVEYDRQKGIDVTLPNGEKHHLSGKSGSFKLG